MKKIMMICLVSLSIWAAPYSVGEKMEPVALADQFGDKHPLTPIPNRLILAFEKETSAIVHEYLSKQKENYLSSTNTAYIADISQMPSFIAEAFALPKMRKYPYRVLLIRDEEMGMKFPSQEHAITIVRLKGDTIQTIEYVSNANQLLMALKKN